MTERPLDSTKRRTVPRRRGRIPFRRPSGDDVRPRGAGWHHPVGSAPGSRALGSPPGRPARRNGLGPLGRHLFDRVEQGSGGLRLDVPTGRRRGRRTGIPGVRPLVPADHRFSLVAHLGSVWANTLDLASNGRVRSRGPCPATPYPSAARRHSLDVRVGASVPPIRSGACPEPSHPHRPRRSRRGRSRTRSCPRRDS